MVAGTWVYAQKNTACERCFLMVARKKVLMNFFTDTGDLSERLREWTLDIRSFLAKEPAKQTLVVTY